MQIPPTALLKGDKVGDKDIKKLTRSGSSKYEEDILRLRAEGKTYRDIEEELKCSRGTISRICKKNGVHGPIRESKYQWTPEFQEAYVKFDSLKEIIAEVGWPDTGASKRAVARICKEKELPLKWVRDKSEYNYSEFFKDCHSDSESLRELAEKLQWEWSDYIQHRIRRICIENDLEVLSVSKNTSLATADMADFPREFVYQAAISADCKRDFAMAFLGVVPDSQIREYIEENELTFESLEKYKFSKDFVDAVRTSTSRQEVFKKLGWLLRHQSSYHRFDAYITEYSIDISHFKPTGKKVGTPDHEFFINGMHRDGQQIKKRLYAQGVKKECSMCGVTQWRGAPVSLEVDHIDGDRENNLINNLRIICPNCHATTDTYRAKNQGKYKARNVSKYFTKYKPS